MELKDLLKDENNVQLIANKAFESLDIKKNGYIEFSDLEIILKELTSDISGTQAPNQEEIKNIFRNYDTHRENRIYYKEFCLLIKELLKLMVN